MSATKTASGRRMMLMIGVGGASSSGKTTLAKHLADLFRDAVHAYNTSSAPGGPLPSGEGRGKEDGTKRLNDEADHDGSRADGPVERADVMIVHQDDFAPKEEDLPWNDEIKDRDWDTPNGSIDYKRMDSVLSYLRENGAFPSSHSSHDHLNILPEVPLPEDFRQHWRERFHNALLSSSSSSSTSQPRVQHHLQIALVDGFLLYFSPLVRRHLDVRFLLRTSRATLQRRREERQGYNTAEGTLWQDPPGYFEKVVWPAYLLAHRGLFESGDVEEGEVVRVSEDEGVDGGKFPGLVVLSGEGGSATQGKGNVEEGAEMRLMVQKACEEVEMRLRQLITEQQDNVDVS